MWPWRRSKGKRERVMDARATRDEAVQQLRDSDVQSRRVDEVAERARRVVRQTDHFARDVERAFWPRGGGTR